MNPPKKDDSHDKKKDDSHDKKKGGDKHEESSALSNAASQAKTYWNRAKDKYSNFMEDVKNDPKLAEAVNLAKTHRKETFFIVLMGLGILISFFSYFGGLVVGVVSTLCLPWDLTYVWKAASDFYEEKGQFKSVIMGLLALYLLLHVSPLIIGAAIGLGLNLFLKNDDGKKSKSHKNKKDDQ